jgi:hypothetical protein
LLRRNAVEIKYSGRALRDLNYPAGVFFIAWSCWLYIFRNICMSDKSNKLRASEVFTPGKLPEITFIDDHLIARSKLLLDALDMGAAVISLSGPSKSGKTVFIEKTLGKDHLLQVTGAGIDSPKKLWDRVFDLIGTPILVKKTEQSGFQGGISGKATAGVSLIAEAKGEVGASGLWSDNKTATEEYSVDYLQLMIRELGGTDFVVFIDDFHYIPKDAQVEISNQIKEAIRGGVKFICAAVPYHSDDVIRANPDLRGRMVKIDFDYWDQDELKKIAIKGFAALNTSLSAASVDALASEAAGSPQLMQALCLNACFESNIRERQDAINPIQGNLFLLESVCARTALMADYSSTVDKMKDGPKTRGMDRKSYVLRDQTASDVYPIILRAMAANPPELTLRYSNLVGRISTLCSANPPSGSSITGACAHMSQIANDAENKVIIEWDSENDVLDIRDPYLLFYLRWAEHKLNG